MKEIILGALLSIDKIIANSGIFGPVLRCTEKLINAEDEESAFLFTVQQRLFELLECQGAQYLALSDLDRLLRILFYDHESSTMNPKHLEILLSLLSSNSWRVKDLGIQHLTLHIEHCSFGQLCEEISLMFALLHDNEMYVRISALKFLSKIPPHQVFNIASRKEQFWLFLNSEKEPLVVLESLPAMSGFLEYAVNEEADHLKLDQFMVTLFNHEDYYLRNVFIEILSVIFWKRGDLFHRFAPHFDCTLSLLEDDSRAVRQRCLEFVSRIVALSSTISGDCQGFVEGCCLVDLLEKGKRCDPEHIYQEILDMDQSLMNEKESPGEGNNVLFCYDC